MVIQDKIYGILILYFYFAKNINYSQINSYIVYIMSSQQLTQI